MNRSLRVLAVLVTLTLAGTAVLARQQSGRGGFQSNFTGNIAVLDSSEMLPQPAGESERQFHPAYTMVDRLQQSSYYLPMALNIKNPQVESLAAEVARLTGETKTEAIRKALEERKDRLAFRLDGVARKDRLVEFLEREVWPVVPADVIGKRLTREEEEALLGFGPEGA